MTRTEKCFLCQKTRHVAKDCLDKKIPMKAIEDAGTRQRPAVMMVQMAPPRPQGGQLADHIRATPGRMNANRFQPLILEKVSSWRMWRMSLLQPRPASLHWQKPNFLRCSSRLFAFLLVCIFPRRGWVRWFVSGKTLVGNCGPSVKDAICKPVLKPVVSKSKIDKQWF